MFNAILACHLGLVVPPRCEMRVHDEVRTWQEGKCLVFDDTYEHEVWNRSAVLRVILFTGTWHPDLTPIEIACLEAFFARAGELGLT
jgi:aspartyl/asparaginyl beta-hydroxylase (cupin superfamily)